MVGLLNPRGKKVISTEGCWLIVSLYIPRSHSMLWNHILSLDTVCASIRRLRCGGLDDRLTQRIGGPWEHSLLYLWARCGRSVAWVNLSRGVGPTDPPGVPKAPPPRLLGFCYRCRSRTPPQTHQRASQVADRRRVNYWLSSFQKSLILKN